MVYTNNHDWQQAHKIFVQAQPYRHIVIDNFFTDEVAAELLKEFPDYDSDVWNAHYHNPLEDKKACDHWLRFPKMTYRVFHYLASAEFEQHIQTLSGQTTIYADRGLHGGGWHAHARGGKLNIHLDYSIHPKLGLERHYNLIVYMTPEWQSSWGGGLELWSHDDVTNQPKEMVTYVENRFNRAVIFDTTQNSWHGLPRNLTCPQGVVRRSLAMYYLTDPEQSAPNRLRAKFAPYGEQANDREILNLIERRQRI